MHDRIQNCSTSRSRPGPAGLILALGLVMTAGAACDAPGPLAIGDATLAVVALGHDPMPPEAEGAPRVVVMPGQPATIPDTPVVELAIDRNVPWAQVRAIVDLMDAKEQTPVFLISQRRKLRAFHLDDELTGPIVQAYATTDGKICVSHPDVKEAKCQKPAGDEYIDPSFTRELVREAVRGYRRTDVEIDLPDALRWSDVVSAVAGSRSCCGDREIRVAIAPRRCCGKQGVQVEIGGP